MASLVNARSLLLSHSSSPSSQSPSNHGDNLKNFFKLLFLKTTEGQLLRIQLSVLVTVILLFFLFLLGYIRRRVHLGKFKYAMKGIYLVIPIYITYIMGLMHNASTLHEMFPVWACSLIYAYGGVDTMTASELGDNEGTLQYFWRTLPLFFWTVWLSIVSRRQIANLLFVSLNLLFLVALFNTLETLAAFYAAGKTKGLPSLIEPTVEYYAREGEEVNREEPDPVSMRGYRYLVWDDPGLPTQDGGAQNVDNSIITTENIWLQQEDMNFLANCPGHERLRDLCLSYAFFRLILIRFAGFPVDESHVDRTRRLFLDGLLSRDGELTPERLFRIIEVELAFLFDFFYTKSYIHRKTFADLHKVWRLMYILLCLGSIVSFSLLSSGKSSTKLFSIQFHGHSLEVGVTRVVIFIFVVLEVWQLIIVACFSNWTIVKLLCACLKELAAGTNDQRRREMLRFMEIRLVHIWTIKDYLYRRNVLGFCFKPWQRRLGQYSFIDNFSKVPLFAQWPISLLRTLVKLPRVGQKGETKVALSTEVKQAIAKSLRDNGLALSCGGTAISQYQLPDDIADECSQLETDLPRVILVWHIATSVCESFHPLQQGNEDVHHFHVANQLSKYCAYLVTFAPTLLPGHPYGTERVFDMAVGQARHRFGGSNVEERYNTLLNMGAPDDNNDIVGKGAHLANRLTGGLMENEPARGWKFLAEFWAELLLYLAPSDNNNVAAHGEYLAEGGEFVTHLWALLTHAGIVTRS